MPVEVILEAMRYHHAIARKAKRLRKKDTTEIAKQYALASGFAASAAPYYHPKLATLQSNVNLTGRLTLEELVLASIPTPANTNDAAAVIEGEVVEAGGE